MDVYLAEKWLTAILLVGGLTILVCVFAMHITGPAR